MKYICAAAPNESAPKSDGDLHKLFWLKRLLLEMIACLWQALSQTRYLCCPMKVKEASVIPMHLTVNLIY